ncbi:MAG: DUF5320 domain-containing protein [Clostridia bacterium]|nr:DUF5320 domain-containing protein [Clostridia bacterium]MDH7572857.1 DUF5320 domain-containing protein [Clostridia bacterium]
MPRGDRTGPWGLGPRTGRGMGFCAGFPVPGFMNPGWFGWGGRPGGWWGGGRGWRHRFWATGVPGWAWWGALPLAAYGLWRAWPSFFGPGAPEGSEKQAEREFLKEQAAFLEKQLEEMKKRLAELEGED